MKYINRREVFLKEFKEISITKSELLNEEVFSNDINWGDSFLGRLINSGIRKATIANNLRRMGQVEQRLKDTFDTIILESKEAELSDEDKKQYSLVVLYAFLNALEQAVMDMEVNKTTLSELRNLTNSTINKVEEIENIDKKNELLRQLKEWKRYIDGLEEPSESTTPTTGVTASTPSATTSTTSQIDVPVDLCIENLKSIKLIVDSYSKMKKEKEIEWKKNSIDRGQGEDVIKQSTAVTQNASLNTDFSNTDLLFENVNTTILNPIKALHSIFTSKPDTLPGLESILKMTPDAQKKYSSFITKIYSYVIKNKSKVNEDIKALLSNDKLVGDKILDLYKVSKTKPDGNFDGVSDDMKKGLSLFNTSLKKILELAKPTQPTNDSKIFTYKTFISINEGYTYKEMVTEIQGWWDINMDIKPWLLDESEFNRIRTNLDKKLAEKKDSIIISDIDPVIEVCKIFNRAYNLHTTKVIPTGRSGGKVSNKTFREYHSFGSGTPENAGQGGGPYRNIKVFESWYDTVMDVLKNREYQPIFNLGTKLKMGDVYVEKAGANLRKFMTDMLDGDEFFKDGSGKGAQAKFLDKYFNWDGDKEKLSIGDDAKKNEEVASAIPPKRVIKFSESILPYDARNTSVLKGTFFITSADGKMRYFYINDIKDNNAYVLFSDSFTYFVNRIDSTKVYKFEDGVAIDKSSASEVNASKIDITKIIGSSGNINALNVNDASYLTPKDKKSIISDTNFIKEENTKFSASKLYTLFVYDEEGKNPEKRFSDTIKGFKDIPELVDREKCRIA